MELRNLRSLVALAELGGIRRVAEKLHLSAAAIHSQLKTLEEEMGVQLYEKMGRQLRLTQVAETLLPHIRNLLAQYEAVVSALDEWKGLKHGVVRVGASLTISSYMLPALIEEFRRRYPAVRLLVETGSTQALVPALSNGALDLLLIVTSEFLEDPGLVVEETWDYEIVLVTREKRVPRRCALRDLRGLPFILHKKGSVFENIIDRYFVEAGFHPQEVIMRFDNSEAIKAMIRSGLGIGLLPMWMVEAESKDKTLKLIRQEEPPLTSKIALVTRKLTHTPQPVQAFIEVTRSWDWKNVRLTSR